MAGTQDNDGGGDRTAIKRVLEQRGFSLIEIAIVLVIFGLLIGGGATLFSGTVGANRERATKVTLGVYKKALEAYYIRQGRLPCPADGSLVSSSTDYGRALPETSTVICDMVNDGTPENGVVPWRTLGMSESASLDGWGHRISYRVSDAVIDDTAIATGDIVVCADRTCSAGTEHTTEAAVVLVSHGRNGFGAWNNQAGTRMPTANASLSEDPNLDGTGDAIDALFSEAVGNNYFDDFVGFHQTWVFTYAAGETFTTATCNAATAEFATVPDCTTVVPGNLDRCEIATAILNRCP